MDDGVSHETWRTPSQSPSVTALPEGEVAERSEDASALSVTFGDSSPKGRAKGRGAASPSCLSLWERWLSGANFPSCLSPWERWLSGARTERVGRRRNVERASPKGVKALSVTFGDSAPGGRAKRGGCGESPLPLPLGEVAERSEPPPASPLGRGGRAERGRRGRREAAIALSVTCGDSSPGGRAKGRGAASPSCLSLWERWPSGARLPLLPPPRERWLSGASLPLLPLPLGEVAERSEDGEGGQAAKRGAW